MMFRFGASLALDQVNEIFSGASVFIANFAFVRCIMKSICLGILGYVWACFAVRSVAFVGTFGSVSMSLFCGVC